tara:strand:+ start:304 stop:1383 length:1080 start_codon:yes stop_codon:yes gene_type:complete
MSRFYIIKIIKVILFSIFFSIFFSSINILFEKNISYFKDSYDFNFSTETDERFYKYFLIKTKPNSKKFIFGNSQATTLNPNYLGGKIDEVINISFSGANIEEQLIFLKWIVNNRNPEKIYLGLNYYSFQNLDFNPNMPLEFQKNIFKKYLNSLNIKNFKIYLKLVKIKLYNFLLNINPKDQSKHFYLGMRTYPNYFNIIDIYNGFFDYKKKFDPRKQFSEAKNSKNFIFEKNLSYEKFMFLKNFVEICIKNNIELKIFFEPVNKIQLLKKDYFILKTELEVIKKIFNLTDVSDIYYFNNFNKINLNNNYYFRDLIHYDYDAGRLIMESINKKNSLPYIVSKKNIKNFEKFILKKINEKK